MHNDPPPHRHTRRAFVVALPLALGLRRPAFASDETTVENWREHPVGARGIPAGWEAYKTPRGRPVYDFAIVDVDGRRALRLASNGDRSTIARSVQVDLARTPILEWSWKVVRLPVGADVRRAAISDAAAQVLVVWPRPPEFLRSRIIAYTWDTTAPVDSFEKSPKVGTVTFVIVRSGSGQLARWLTERRDVAADYRRIFGEDPDPLRAVALSIDTNDTRAPAEAFVGPIAFRRA